jgi:hypothetical protein
MPRSLRAAQTPQNQNREAAGMDAGCNGFISFLQSKKLTAQKRQGGRF